MRNATKWLRHNNFFWEARTRIFAWYVGLSTVLVGMSIPIFTQLAINQVDARVREDLAEELEAFETSLSLDTEAADVALIFDRYLQYKIPADKTFLITTIDGKFYRSSPLSVPQILSADSSFINNLAQTTKPIKGKNTITDVEAGDITYKAEPVRVKGQVRGVLIVASIPEGERIEVFRAILIVVEVLLAALLIALFLAWMVAGNVLRPVRILIDTAKTISKNDLSQRIPILSSRINRQGEMAELARTFNSMMDRLETDFIKQRQFLNDASHKLRTPITIVRGHLELLEYNDPEERAETIHLVLDELDHMGRFVEDLLLLAKADRHDFLILNSVDLGELTREIYLQMQGLGERQWQLDSLGEGIVTLDRQRIIQAMINLVENAIQHTDSTDTIALGSTVTREQISLWVRDTGIGIPVEDQERIFERFTRSSNSLNHQGAGLGLSIVLAIAKSHQGHVELHSQVGQGSTFTIVLPKDPS